MLAAPTMNIFSNTTNHPSIPTAYTYSSSSTTILPTNPMPVSSSPVSVRPLIAPMTHTVENQATIPLKNLQISSTSSPMTSSPRPSTTTTTVPNVVQLNPSPIKPFNATSSSSSSSLNNDVVVHYIGGFVIRESSQPFPNDDHHRDDNDNHDEHMKDSSSINGKDKEKENTSFNDSQSDLGSDQLRCYTCKKVDFAERFYNQEKKFCTRSCSVKSSKINKINQNKKIQHDRTPPIHEPTRIIETSLPVQTVNEIQLDEQIPLAPDHGLPTDPSKWTVGVNEILTYDR
jgi:hypothetical protein